MAEINPRRNQMTEMWLNFLAVFMSSHIRLCIHYALLKCQSFLSIY
jgi:hypothetical protein